jgi:predicted nucleotidyltransferase
MLGNSSQAWKILHPSGKISFHLERFLSVRLDVPLDDLFLNRSHVRVLRALHKLPEGFVASGRELARRAGVTHPTALKALSLLVNVGVVTADRGLVGDVYELNRNHLFAAHVVSLFEAEAAIGVELAAVLREGLHTLTDKVESATLFGSAVWGESSPRSDVDVAVSCAPGDLEEVESALEELAETVQRRFGNQLSPLVDSGRRKRRPAIWKRIESEGVPLIRSGKPVIA